MLLWGEVAQGHIRAVVIVGPHPTRGEVLNFFNIGGITKRLLAEANLDIPDVEIGEQP
jgi:hypothetical protein